MNDGRRFAFIAIWVIVVLVLVLFLVEEEGGQADGKRATGDESLSSQPLICGRAGGGGRTGARRSRRYGGPERVGVDADVKDDADVLPQKQTESFVCILHCANTNRVQVLLEDVSRRRDRRGSEGQGEDSCKKSNYIIHPHTLRLVLAGGSRFPLSLLGEGPSRYAYHLAHPARRRWRHANQPYSPCEHGTWNTEHGTSKNGGGTPAICVHCKGSTSVHYGGEPQVRWGKTLPRNETQRQRGWVGSVLSRVVCCGLRSLRHLK